jgi:selenocysteine lyase/cysteine desulfurase
MLSCEDLSDFTDRLCDLTRQMNGAERVREATELLVQIEEYPQRFIMQWRAAAAADLRYLEGRSLRQIAEAAGRSKQGADQWLQHYGPTHYLSLIKEDDQVRAVAFEVEGRHTKVKVRQYRAAGRIVVPAVENAYDPATGGARAGIDLQQLWEHLAQES